MQKGMYLTTPLLIKQVLNKVLFLQVLTLNCMYPLLQKQKEGVCVCVGAGGGAVWVLSVSLPMSTTKIKLKKKTTWKTSKVTYKRQFI